ncbi:MAG: L-rhamnose isomerase, partial [Spirochaetia bacterium]|nr:L-rhamnose isomerase [Spirochaetia bacterium]
MKIEAAQIEAANQSEMEAHKKDFDYLNQVLQRRGLKAESLISKLAAFQVATPSWALGTGGTRFGRFPGPGEPATLEDKIADVGILHKLTRATSNISLHIPWDDPKDPAAIKDVAKSHGIVFDSVNSNTFQDQPNQKQSYKFGSVSNTKADVRKLAIEHNIHCIKVGEKLGVNALTVWLADGSNFPGQTNFQKSFTRTAESLKEVYAAMPKDWLMYVEHKPFEPNFYSSVVNDWGSALSLAREIGEHCHCLVDLGHHLPNTNIEQVVSRLLMNNRLGGFHFNDSKYADDDLTTGSIKPYQLFLIFNELIPVLDGQYPKNPKPAFMIDESHNTKDPLEDLLQSFEALG